MLACSLPKNNVSIMNMQSLLLMLKGINHIVAVTVNVLFRMHMHFLINGVVFSKSIGHYIVTCIMDVPPIPACLYDTVAHMVLFMQNNKKPVKNLIKYMLDVATGMHYISEKGLVHRVCLKYNMAYPAHIIMFVGTIFI